MTSCKQRSILTVLLLGVSIAKAAEQVGVQNAVRRKRDTNNIFATHSRTDQGLEDLWDAAAHSTQGDFDLTRMGGVMSMPTMRPTRSPVTIMPSPTAAPNQPTDPTNSPTSSPVVGPTAEPLTLMPTADCLGQRTKSEYFLDILSTITPTTILRDTATPQGMAFNFLVDQDSFLSNPCYEALGQRYALTTLYFAGDGATWLQQDGWLGSDQECEWFGVTCPSESSLATRLELPNNNIRGSLPDEVSALYQLQRFDLYFNSITGTLPTGISNLTQLILLDVEQNNLRGPAFPQVILELQSLIAYRASDNELTGTIPPAISDLSNLEQMWVAENELRGSIPTSIGQLSRLQSIFLYENEILGSLPTELGLLLELEDFRVQDNFLQDSLPSQLFSLESLVSLRLELNFFEGDIPPQIGNLENLVDFRINENSISGEIPLELGFLTNLEIFIAHNNFLSGSIPDVFGNFDRLDFFDVSNALFTGGIPSTLFDVPTLRIVYMSNNTLTGNIPANYADPPLLRDLFLDGNRLQGTIPAIGSGQLQDLNELLLHFNSFTGSMPASLCSLRGAGGNLDDLFSDCGGQLPEVQCEFPQCCNRCFEGGRTRRLAEQGQTERESKRRRMGGLGRRDTSMFDAFWYGK